MIAETPAVPSQDSKVENDELTVIPAWSPATILSIAISDWKPLPVIPPERNHNSRISTKRG